MCAIIGICEQTGDHGTNALRTLRNSMAHRGPDGVGEFVENEVGMAMCRLAVIDKTHGGQPITSLDGKVVVFQNGEIYNYTALRNDLERAGFRCATNCDTEVLAHGYACWGISGLLDRIEGMYAIAILDRRTKQIHLARDRFGEKPLFYAHAPGCFAYASSLLPLAALPWVDTSIDVVALDRYLALHFVPGDRTIFKGVRRVLPGERLCVSTQSVTSRRSFYYRLSLGEPCPSNDKELEDCLEQAVKSRLIADVPVGVFLSGGIDSSLVAAMAARHSPGIATFSMGFLSSEHDERRYAEAVARHIRSKHHTFIFKQDSFEALLSEVVDALDEPLGDQATLPVYWLSREARRHVTVVLSGEGADELFGGYDYYRGWLPSEGMGWTRSDLRRLIENPVSISPSGFPLITTKEDRTKLLGRSILSFDHWEREFMTFLDGALSSVQRAGAADLSSWLPDDLLVKLDRMTMAHSLEGRAPYLDRAVVESALRLPDWDRLKNGTNKIALRRIARHWLPADIVARSKQGFVLPMRRWLQDWLGKRGGTEAYFRGSNFPALDTEQAARIIRAKNDERLTFAIIMLLEWHRSFKGRMNSLRALITSAS